MAEEDAEIEKLKQKKLDEMKKALSPAPSRTGRKMSNDELVRKMLYDRGEEVLDAAYSAYPVHTKDVVDQLASLIRKGEWVEKVSGGELYAIFRELGMRFSLNTSIKVEEHGRLVDLSEKLKGIR